MIITIYKEWLRQTSLKYLEDTDDTSLENLIKFLDGRRCGAVTSYLVQEMGISRVVRDLQSKIEELA